MHLVRSDEKATGDVSLGVLGPLAVSVDGRPVRVRPGRPRLLLLALAVEAGRRVSVDELDEWLWPDEQPRNPKNAVHILISYLRRALGPGGSAIETADHGYRLAVGREAIDAFVFEDAVRFAGRVDDPSCRLRVLDEALSAWRGEPLAEARYESFAQPEIRRLHELRVAASAARAEAELDLGFHNDAVTTLVPMVAAHPLNERLRVLLMTALYRAGRQADALRLYDDARSRLLDELGVDPGPELRGVLSEVLGVWK